MKTVIKNCAGCGKPFKVTPDKSNGSYRKKTCSPECIRLAKKKNNIFTPERRKRMSDTTKENKSYLVMHTPEARAKAGPKISATKTLQYKETNCVICGAPFLHERQYLNIFSRRETCSDKCAQRKRSETNINTDIVFVSPDGAHYQCDHGCSLFVDDHLDLFDPQDVLERRRINGKPMTRRAVSGLSKVMREVTMVWKGWTRCL